MKIVEKYVFKSYIISFIFCIILLIVLGIIGDILGFIDDIFKHDIPLMSILSFYFYLAPFAFCNMVPFACLLSAVYVFNSLSKNHEITAIIASGINLWKLLRPVLFVTFILCLSTFIVNDKFVPSTMEKANRIKKEKLEQQTGESAREMHDITLYGESGEIIYARSFSPDTNTLKNVIIHKQDADKTIVEKVSVRLVRWTKDETWEGEDAIIFNVDSNGNFTGDPQIYKRKKINIEEKPNQFRDSQWDPKFMSYKQLKEYIKIFSKGSPSTVNRLKVDLNYKLSFPFTALITVLIGVPFSIETGRANALIGMAKGIGVAMLYLPVMAVCLALGKGGVLPPALSAWLSNIIFIFTGIYFVNKKS